MKSPCYLALMNAVAQICEVEGELYAADDVGGLSKSEISDTGCPHELGRQLGTIRALGACNLSAPGLSNSCAQNGHSMTVVFADSVWGLFLRTNSRPFKE
jgi:hypothetical protein